MSGWKPGDVALVRAEGFGEGLLALRCDGDWATIDGDWWDDSRVTPVRRLLVIDPEDCDEFAARLVDALIERKWPLRERTAAAITARAALRSLAEPLPVPPIEEPTRLGSVVVDEHGRKWVRNDVGGAHWYHPGRWSRWPDIRNPRPAREDEL